MSLTNFVEQEEIRSRINEAYPNQGDSATGPMGSEPRTSDPQRVGTAFDYLCRWWIQRRTDDCTEYRWVAEKSLPVAEERFPDKVSEIEDAIQTAKRHRSEYLETGTATRPLVESALDLASIDTIYRAQRPPDGLGSYDDADIVDCIKLLGALPDSELPQGDEAFLNPTFGAASPLVGGADADLIIDNTLIDIKTVKSPTFKASDWRQLVGYLVLADLHALFHEEGVYQHYDEYRETKLPEIESFCIYFSRYGELSKVPADEIYSAPHYEEFRSWFATKAEEQYPRWSTYFGNLVQDLL